MNQTSCWPKYAAMKHGNPAVTPQDHFKLDDGHILSIPVSVRLLLMQVSKQMFMARLHPHENPRIDPPTDPPPPDPPRAEIHFQYAQNDPTTLLNKTPRLLPREIPQLDYFQQPKHRRDWSDLSTKTNKLGQVVCLRLPRTDSVPAICC